MKLWPKYASPWGRFWDMVAGFITAILINTFILILSERGFSGYLFSILPWAINGLFLLVFILILPWFDVGYLLATLMISVLSIFGLVLILAGRLLPRGVGAALESVSAMLDAPSQREIPLDKLPPNLTHFAQMLDKVIHITSIETIGYLLLILLSLLLMIFLLHSLDRK